MGECYTWDNASVWHKHWPETIHIGHWPIFHGPVSLPYILKTVWWTNVIIGILVPCDTNIYLIKGMWVSDLYFMVQWLCVLSWRLFDVWMLYWEYWFSVMHTLTWNHICRSVTYISWSSDYVFYLEDCLMYECYTESIGSVWCIRWPETTYVGQWPIFHGKLILPYILKSIWWTNVIIEILVPCDAKINLIKCMWVSDLHCMWVQWLCLLSWRLFGVCMLYWGYWFIVTQFFT